RTPLLSHVLAIALLGLFASPAPTAQDEDDAAPASMTTNCQLYLYLDERGTTTFQLNLVLAKPTNIRAEPFEKALASVFGDSLREVRRQKIPAGNYLLITGRIDHAFP